MAVVAFSAGQIEIGLVIVLCFTGVLRVSEPLALTGRDVMIGPGLVVLVLAVTKRGVEQRVVIKNPTVCQWMRFYFSRSEISASQFVFPISYSKVMYWIRKLSGKLGFENLALTSHSFRRGGATHLLARG